jgi:thioredoxin 1
MSNNISIQKIIIALIIIGLIGFVAGNLSTNNAAPEAAVTTKETIERNTMTTDTMETESGDQVAASNTMTDEPTLAAAEAGNGTFTDYDPALLANAESGDVILFFHASWCPSCRALERSIENNLSDLPADVTILQIDFDNSSELRQKYGVTRQHTLVRVDAEGGLIETLDGLTITLDQVLAKL